MNEHVQQRDDGAEQARQARHEFRSYAWGIGLALALTLVPFAAVHWQLLPRRALFITIGAFALVQMVVHFRFFLHIGFRQHRDDLQLILFSGLLLLIMIGGTLWIMGSLARRMVLP